MKTKARRFSIDLVVGTVISLILLMFCAIPTARVQAAEIVKLRLSCWGLAEELWGGYLREMVGIFEKENPNIKVRLEKVTYATKGQVFVTQSEARAASDVARFTYDSIRKFSEKGYLYDIAPLIKEERKGFLEQWHENMISVVSYEGHVYALPEEYHPFVLVYNTEMFKAVGLNPDKPPGTWSEFIEYAKKLTGDTDGDGKVDQWGFGLIGAKEPGMYPRFSPFIWSAGGDYLTPDQKHSALNTSEALEGFKNYVETVIKHDVVPPGPAEIGCHDVRTQLAHRKVAMILGTAFTPGIVNKINPDLNAFKVLRMAAVPVGKVKATSCLAGIWVISAGTKHPRESFKLVKFLTGKKSQIEAFRVNGWVSARKDAANSPEVLGDKFASVVAAQTDYARFLPLIPEWPEIGDIIINAVQEAITRVKTPEKALADAHILVNKVFARR